MKDFILLDTLHLFIRYPKTDVFERFYRIAQGTSYRHLKFGIPYKNFVIKNGSCGYKLSVWQHDARIYLTDQVDEVVGEGKGMGAWLQLGPKFLISSNDNLQEAVKLFLSEIGIGGGFEIRISRLDLAIDLMDISMKDIDLEIWKKGWVGRSKLSASFNNSRTGALETINIGKRCSPVFLRIYDKVAQAKKEGDIDYWFDVWGGFRENVTRVEWEVKPNKGGFKGLEDFEKLNGFAIRELLNYLLNWGRLCVPDLNNFNRARWKEDPFWVRIKNFAEKWVLGVDWAISRIGKEFQGMSDAYKRSFFGQLSSGMARFSENEPNIFGLIEGMEKSGIRLEAINAKAKFKQRVFKNL
jgi:hypothetical protein